MTQYDTNWKFFVGIALVLVILLFAGGCSRAVREVGVLGWPPPPQEPQVIYKQSIYGSKNLKRSFFGSLRDFLFGESPDMALAKPYGITIDSKERLFIADTGKKSVIVIDFNAGTMESFNSLDSHGKLGEPINVILDESENIYVSDTGLGKVAVFDKTFQFSHFIGNDGDLVNPVGMAIHEEAQRLYVVDAALHEVKIFDLAGSFLSSFGGRGDQKGEFYHPLGIAIDGEDTIYVVDTFHFAVQAFTLDGDYIFSFGPAHDGIGSMARPRAIALDSDNHLYVTDALNHNIQMYNTDGELLITFGVVGFSPGQFRLPAGICITDDDTIYIADSINRRIQEFRSRAHSSDRGSLCRMLDTRCRCRRCGVLPRWLVWVHCHAPTARRAR